MDDRFVIISYVASVQVLADDVLCNICFVIFLTKKKYSHDVYFCDPIQINEISSRQND